MYKNVEQVLRDVYKIQGVRMEPLNNTASVCAWCESKGVMGGGGDLTQAETHANAAMIISRIERILNRYECGGRVQIQCGFERNYRPDGIHRRAKQRRESVTV